MSKQKVAGEGAGIRSPYDSRMTYDVEPGTVAVLDQAYVTFVGTRVEDYRVDGQVGAWLLTGEWAVR